jgi:hypothetical protein
MNGLSSPIESPRRGDRFACTPAGVIAASRRRFSAFLMALASLMTVATLATIAAGRYVPALMAGK